MKFCKKELQNHKILRFLNKFAWFLVSWSEISGMSQLPLSRYPGDHQLHTEISGRSRAPCIYRDLQNFNSLPTKISGRSAAPYWDRSLEGLNCPFRDIRKIISSILRYLEDQRLTAPFIYQDLQNFNASQDFQKISSTLLRSLEGLNCPFRDNRKIISSLLRYLEDQQPAY